MPWKNWNIVAFATGTESRGLQSWRTDIPEKPAGRQKFELSNIRD